MKSEALLEAKASAAIADAAAFIFIDAIDPIGTVNPLVHERMGAHLRPADALLRAPGRPAGRGRGIYYSLESKFNFAANGRDVGQPDTSDAHTASSMQASRRLIGAHLPFGVITKTIAGQAGRAQAADPVERQHDGRGRSRRDSRLGARGGTLLASGGTFAGQQAGPAAKRFHAGRRAGRVARQGRLARPRALHRPDRRRREVVRQLQRQVSGLRHRAGHGGAAREGAEVLATTTLPWPAPIGSQILVDPQQPALAADRPARDRAESFWQGPRDLLRAAWWRTSTA